MGAGWMDVYSLLFFLCDFSQALQYVNGVVVPMEYVLVVGDVDLGSGEFKLVSATILNSLQKLVDDYFS